MTRTQLIRVALQAIKESVEMQELGTKARLYTSLYQKRTILIFTDINSVPLGVIYKDNYYAFRELTLALAGIRRQIYIEFSCKALINLYQSRTYVFKDAQGEYKAPGENAINKATDYAFLIPIPYRQ